jgi:hypothetical protein
LDRALQTINSHLSVDIYRKGLSVHSLNED